MLQIPIKTRSNMSPFFVCVIHLLLFFRRILLFGEIEWTNLKGVRVRHSSFRINIYSKVFILERVIAASSFITVCPNINICPSCMLTFVTVVVVICEFNKNKRKIWKIDSTHK